MGIDVLEVIRRHADSHRSLAESDAYSAQEAPRLEASAEALIHLFHAIPGLLALYRIKWGNLDHGANAVLAEFEHALAAAQGGKSDG